MKDWLSVNMIKRHTETTNLALMILRGCGNIQKRIHKTCLQFIKLILNRERGLEGCSSIWIGLLNKLEILYNKLLPYKTENIPVIAYSDLTLVDDNKVIINKSFWNELNHHHHEHCLETLLFGNFITGHSIIMNAKMKDYFLSKPKDLILHDVWIAFIANSFGKAIKINEPLALYRQHSENVNYNLNFTKPSLLQERWKKLKMIFVKNNYLEQEFKIASVFYTLYKKELSQNQLLLFENFLKAENKTFLFKYLLLKKYFKHHWIK